MKNYDLEAFYKKIKRNILLPKSHTRIEYLTEIIKSCRLKPYSAFVGNFATKERFEEHWVDEFGNSLKFENKIPRIIMNDPNIVANTQISSDLFLGRSVKSICDMSKFAFIARADYIGRSCWFVGFYGEDEYLRSFFYDYKWNIMSPLLFGIENLQIIFKNIKSPWINEISVNNIFGMNVNKAITTAIPVRQNILNYFDEEIVNEII